VILLQRLKQKKIEKKNKYYNYLNFLDVLSAKQKMKPRTEALKIALIYGIIGALWILYSDALLERLVNDLALFRVLQTIKGWFFVAVSAILIYLLIHNKMKMLEKAINRITEGYEELSGAHEELVAIEEELRQQYNQLEESRIALDDSEKRFFLTVEGSNDGIWDWDVQNNKMFFSNTWKTMLGFEPADIEDSIESWKELLHPDDRTLALNKLMDTFDSNQNLYQNIYRLRRKDGEYTWIYSRATAIRDSSGKITRLAGSHTDITEQKKAEDHMYILAYYDELTKLPNRALFEKLFKELLEKKKHNADKMAVLYLDIDNFKNVNDILGHAAGDSLLRYLSQLLRGFFKAPNIVARLSGDEFIILLVERSEPENIEKIIAELTILLKNPWIIEKYEFFITVSIGIATYPEHGEDTIKLLKNADTAMFHAKEIGKNRHCFFSLDMQEKALKYIDLDKQLRYALKNEEFLIYYQPQIDLKTGKIIGVEALIRWIHPFRGLISPIEFIPFAEENGLIIPIEEWVFANVWKQKESWQKAGFKDLKISLNLSAKSLANTQLSNNIIEHLLGNSGKDYRIQLEITETAVISDITASTALLNELKLFGATIALDDFGTGYSSLNYLKRLPIDVIKMDKSFIRSVTSKKDEESIAKAVIQLAHDLDLQVVAEGIETIEQLQFLQKYNCDIGQGYLFCKPLPAEEIEKILKEDAPYRF